MRALGILFGLLGIFGGSRGAGAQPTSVVVPGSPHELEAWLDADPSGERLLGALVASSRGLPPAVGSILARHLVKDVPEGVLESRLHESRALASGAEAVVASVLLDPTPPIPVDDVASYWASCVRSRIERLLSPPGTGSPGGVPTREQMASLLDLLLLSPDALATSPLFRERLTPMLERAWPENAFGSAAAKLRASLLYAVDSIPAIDFETSERIEAAWKAVPRRSAEREVSFRPGSAFFPDDIGGRVRASVFSFPSRLFEAADVETFLAAVRRLAPERKLVVLSDPPLSAELAARLHDLDVELVETYGRRYSPWPRDPMSFLRRSDGGTLVLIRPNVQSGRPEDDFMGRELIQGLPAALDAAWGRPVWARSSVPFHNGQVLLDPGRAWVSVNGLEPRILEILDQASVTEEDFATGARALRYLEAARRAARELSRLYGRDARFVHPVPDDPDGAREALRIALGGAGFDLDSLLTIVKGPGDLAEEAMVADLRAGAELLSSAGADEWREFRDAYGLVPTIGREALASAESAPRASALESFLDAMAGSLESQGLRVRRLPLLVVPVVFLRDHGGIDTPEFLITWNNVVLQDSAEGRRAEGFSGLLAGGDAAAQAVFREAGYRLDLLPPLIASVVRNGGYRCASQVLRSGERRVGSARGSVPGAGPGRP